MSSCAESHRPGGSQSFLPAGMAMARGESIGTSGDQPGAALKSPSEIYLDHHATTPVDPRVAELVMDTMTTKFGNANSVDHRIGHLASAQVRAASREIASLVGADPDGYVHFTSGASEALRLAIEMVVEQSATAVRIATSRIEHRAVLDVLEKFARQGRIEIEWIDNDQFGAVSLESVEETLRRGASVICLMAANNEVGTLQPVQAAAKLAASYGSRILVDATQSAGKEPIEVGGWELDFVCFSAHKLYGPKGVGALVGTAVTRSSIANTVAHAGTPNVPGIVGFAEACRIQAVDGLAYEARIRMLRDKIQAQLVAAVPLLQINGAQNNRLGNNLHVSALGAPNEAVVARLRGRVAISTGAACTSGVPGPSHVLQALGLNPLFQESALRISPGRSTTEDDVDTAVLHIADAIASVRAVAGDQI